MMSGSLVLRGLLNYKNYVRYAGVINKLRDVDKSFRVLFSLIADYYTRYPTADIPPQNLLAFFTVQYPDPSGLELAHDVLKQMVDMDITQDDILKQAMNRFTEKYFLNQIVQACIPVLEDQEPTAVEQVQEYLTQLRQVTDDIADSASWEPIQIRDVLEYTESEGLTWVVPILHEALGPVRNGFLYHLYARPDSGKTSLCCHLAAHFAFQFRRTDECILYLNNEEHINRVRRRILCALLNVTPSDLISNEERLQGEFERKGGGRIISFGDCQSVVEVERYISTFAPRVVFIDTGPKVAPLGSSTASEPERKHQTYKRLRELANQYACAIITTGQADASADGKRYLTLSQMDGSKVGIPSELDAAIGIGIGTASQVRFFSVTKNKILGTYNKSGPYVLNSVTSRFAPQT